MDGGAAMTSHLSPEAVAQMVADLDLFSRCGDVGMMDRDMAIDAKATITTLAAENATLRADAAKALQWAKEQHACTDEYAADVVALRASEAAALERVAELEAALANPVAVHANMLRGTIANPTPDQIIHLYGVDALCKALAPMIVREALEPTEYERKVAQMKEDFPNGI